MFFISSWAQTINKHEMTLEAPIECNSYLGVALLLAVTSTTSVITLISELGHTYSVHVVA